MHTKPISISIGALTALFMATGCQSSGGAEGGDAGFPQDPIKFVVGFSPGGGADTMARALAQGAEGPCSVPVSVENREGAGGTTANAFLAQAKPDGYTISLGHTGSSILTPVIAGSPTWESFAPVALIHAEEEFLFVQPGKEWETIDDIIAYASENPGEFTIGATPVGGIDSLVALKLEQEAGVDFNYVPYDSGGDAVLSLMAGDIDMYIGNLGEISASVDAGKILPVAVASEESSDVADVPTLTEKGWDVNFQQWRGVFAPEGTPAEHVEAVASCFEEALQTQEWEDYRESSRSVDRFLGPEEFEEFLETEEEKFLPLLEELDLANN